eukprot:scaffold7037_cov311-Pinguiococcus_pyrenoidosus.AAC.7
MPSSPNAAQQTSSVVGPAQDTPPKHPNLQRSGVPASDDLACAAIVARGLRHVRPEGLNSLQSLRLMLVDALQDERLLGSEVDLAGPTRKQATGRGVNTCPVAPLAEPRCCSSACTRRGRRHQPGSHRSCTAPRGCAPRSPPGRPVPRWGKSCAPTARADPQGCASGKSVVPGCLRDREELKKRYLVRNSAGQCAS